MLDKLILEIEDPESSLKSLAEAMRILTQPDVSREQIQQCQAINKMAAAASRVIDAYIAYRKLEIKILEKKIWMLQKRDSTLQ